MTRVLVIGAYGMIGAEIARDLTTHGIAVTALGRNKAVARKVLPGADWVFHDLRELTTPADWAVVIAGHSHVINCAGALQDNARDDLATVHDRAIAALAKACAEAGVGVIQISAVGAEASAPTEFMGSKARGDAAVRAAGGDWWIYRPGLVLARTGYGGTVLMRLLAAVPVIQPITFARTRMQTIGMADITALMRRTLAGDIPPGTEADLVEDEAHTLEQIVGAYRAWLGFAPARMILRLPGWTTRPVGWLADGLGRLGWRSPLRTTALRVTAGGVSGDAGQTRAVLGQAATPLHETLAQSPARAEDRLSARIGLLMPVIIAGLSLFWIASGLIGAARVNAAAATLADWPLWLARTSVLFWALVDVALGLAVLYRPWVKPALWAMVTVCGIYLASASLFTPALWLDPLGPLVKILPAALLALVALPMVERR